MTNIQSTKVQLYECFHLCMSAQKFPESKRVHETFRHLCWVHLKESQQFSTKVMRDTPPVDKNCFEVVNGKTLVGLMDFLVKDVPSLFECQRHCSISKTQHGVLCKSAVFYANERECAIVADNRITMPDLYVNDQSSVYIENKCATNEPNIMKKMKDDKLPALFSFTIDDDKSEKSDLEDHGIELDVEEEEEKVTTRRTPEPLPAERSTGAVPPQHMNLPALVTPPALSVDEEEQQATRHAEPIPTRQTTGAVPPKEHLLPTMVTHPSIENSGYDSYGSAAQTSFSHSAQPKVETIDAKTLDSYGMEEKSSSHEFFKRFHDEQPKQCFEEVFPPYIEADKIFVARSLEGCIEQCRICTTCVKNDKCAVVGFELQKQRCALARQQPILKRTNNENIGGFVYFVRGNNC
uniref:Apple domain-containing protein n=1 Tax=Acrobeloides nanus TaxID=290746 RepID=A0A914CG12_9BILA